MAETPPWEILGIQQMHNLVKIFFKDIYHDSFQAENIQIQTDTNHRQFISIPLGPSTCISTTFNTGKTLTISEAIILSNSNNNGVTTPSRLEVAADSASLFVKEGFKTDAEFNAALREVFPEKAAPPAKAAEVKASSETKSLLQWLRELWVQLRRHP
jgi:hypothetical protein